jgi:pimeloyl-ACP methyl ester carboxylesterase
VAHDLEGSYDLVMTDARGHGRSGGITTGFSTTILADDAAAVIRGLGLEKPYLFGHSMGARTAATVAANYPDLVRAIVLEDPPLVERLPFQTNEGQAARQRWQWVFDLKALPREERIARGFTMNPNWAEEEVIPWADSKAEVQTDLLERGGALSSYPWREIIARIECPILLITGDPESGAIVTPEAAQEAARLWKNGEVVHISGAGHNIRRDRYDEMMAAVKAFLNRT